MSKKSTNRGASASGSFEPRENTDNIVTNNAANNVSNVYLNPSCSGNQGNAGITGIRRNPLREVRRFVDYQCHLCEKRDNEEMVQCDGCDRWFHFVCVQVTEEIANVSWICPTCKTQSFIAPPNNTQHPITEQHNPLPPVSKSVSNRSGSRTSSRSEARRLKELELKKLEEELELEKRFLERKYKLLRECGSEASSINEEYEDDQLSKIEEWLAETERHGEAEDSGLAEAANEQTSNRSSKLEEHKAPAVQRTSHPSILRTNQTTHRSQCDVPLFPAHQRHQSGFPSTVPDMENNRLSQNVRYCSSMRPQFVEEHIRSEQPLTEDLSERFARLKPSVHPRTIPSSLPGTSRHLTREVQTHHQYPQGAARPVLAPTLNPNMHNEFVPGQRSTPILLAQAEPFDELAGAMREQRAERDATACDDGGVEEVQKCFNKTHPALSKGPFTTIYCSSPSRVEWPELGHLKLIYGQIDQNKNTVKMGRASGIELKKRQLHARFGSMELAV
ncbi:bromodomain adjacent to zinc finger domain protein 1A-like [Aedes aegypti]|uniref:Uncharacterized protein n=1 Tax=Aedes aegypti TaxID=7159 RepID=A0A6I8U354_AEDAE|nr:bromodomain adjacent to zinc finger domain protein 1A-like [Aedes aegypti]